MTSGTQAVRTACSTSFALSHTQQSFRLFELPDDLVELIASGSNPYLQLKSASETSATAPLQTPEVKSSEYVHLCSEKLEKSWSVRQVSTSNEVYITEARLGIPPICPTRDGDIDMTGAEPEEMDARLVAIGKTDSTLELLPSVIDVEAQLRRLLPTYNYAQLTSLFEESDGSARGEVEFPLAKNITTQIPASDTSIQKVWRRLCVSQSPKVAQAAKEYFIPTPQILDAAWNAIFASYTIRTSGKGAIEKTDFEEGGQGSDELVSVKAAIWNYLCSDDGVHMDEDKTITWVERVVWECMWTCASPRYPKTDSLDQIQDLWRELLPHQWQSRMSVDRLEPGSFELFKEGQTEKIRWTQGSTSTLAPKANGTKIGKRKWHEKFRDGRSSKS